MKRSDKGKAPVRPSRGEGTGRIFPQSSSSVPIPYLQMMKNIHKEAKRIDDSRPLKKRKSLRDKKSVFDLEADTSEVISISSSNSPEELNESDLQSLRYYSDHKENSSNGDYGDDDDDDDDGEEEEDEMEWEEVNLVNGGIGDGNGASGIDDYQSSKVGSASTVSKESGDGIIISLSKDKLGKKEPSTRGRTRAVLSRAEKEERLLVHKIHLLCLLYHVSLRNKWCRDIVIRKVYRKVLSPNIIQELYPPDHLSNTLKTRKFLDGLRHAVMAWSNKFHITHKGLRMLNWNELFRRSRMIENKMTLEKFRNHLLKFKGSTDLCAQGFCALLRSVDIDARLVCSLQPLDFTSNIPVGSPDPPAEETSNSNDSSINHLESGAGLVYERDNRSSPIPASEYPIYWVEAWDRAGSRWVTVDPTVTKSVDIIRSSTKSKLEPPYSDNSNILRYVIAFELNGRARDVTRRYAFHYNSKTRKKRITCTESGRLWWERVMKVFRPKTLQPRDLSEIAELNSREAAEGLPTSIQDFKGHPVFVLEQHLHQNEVLDPKVPCGTLALKSPSKKGRSGSFGKGSCPIYRRKDVKIVRSAQAWYRFGRIIKAGSQPLKHVKPRSLSRRSAPVSSFSDDDHTEDNIGETDGHVGLYSLDQTLLYDPPPVIDGTVPKNGFGNVDVYVPSMVPTGACHLKYQNIAVAAKLLGIDYADAVCGFDFNNRKMTPKIQGIVIAEEYREAVMAVYSQLLEELAEEDRQAALAQALLRWRRYFIALRIKDRLSRIHGKVTEKDGEDDFSGQEIDEVIEIDDSDEIMEISSNKVETNKLYGEDLSSIKLVNFAAAAAALREEDDEEEDDDDDRPLLKTKKEVPQAAIVLLNSEEPGAGELSDSVNNNNVENDDGILSDTQKTLCDSVSEPQKSIAGEDGSESDELGGFMVESMSESDLLPEEEDYE